MKILLAFIAASAAGSVFAQTWTQANVPTNNWWTGIASSSDGSKLVAVGNGSAVYTSTNFGVTWISNNVPGIDESAGWASVASSEDGTKLIASQYYSYSYSTNLTSWIYPGYIYTSTNSGITWQQTSAPKSEWGPVASSADGIKLAAVNYYIFTSTNSGASWIQTSAPGGGWGSIAASADGNFLVAAPPSGSIYTSTNSGATWIETSATANYWRSVVSSADGTKLAALSANFIYSSTNSGVTWIVRTNVISNGYSIVSSSDGRRLAAAVWTRLCTSADSGVTWQRHPDAPFFNSGYSIASSADGNILALAELGGPVYIWSNPPPILPTVSISLTNFLKQQRGYTNYVVLSWPHWAANVVVQQNSNLSKAGWAAVTNLPKLITNTKAQTTNYQVILPLNGSQGFYRLYSP